MNAVTDDRSLWAITTYFNPLGYRSRRANFRVFRELLSVPLLAVEYSTDAFQLQDDDADILVQVRGRDVMWQKERLYNVARQHLPPECEFVAWIDCDIAISEADWPQRLKESLSTHTFVQPFRRLALFGPEARPPMERDDQVLDWRDSLIAHVGEHGDIPGIYRQWGTSLKRRYAHGIAWAATRTTCEQFDFYDRLIVGGGDKAFTAALFGQQHLLAPTFAFDERYMSHYLQWAARTQQLAGGSLGFIHATACHLWHGPISERGYDDRQEKLRLAGYSAMDDIGIDPESGCWRFVTDKPALHDYVRSHFIRRREDG